MNVNDRQLYIAGVLNEHLGCAGLTRAEKIAELDDAQYARLREAFVELWHDAQEHSRIFVIDGKFVERVPYEKVITELLNEDWREWRERLNWLTTHEWWTLRQVLEQYRESYRREVA